MTEHQQLLERLNSSDFGVRLQAIQDSATVPSVEVVLALGRLLRDGSIGAQSRQAVSEALGQNPCPEAWAVLLAASTSDDASERELAAIGLGRDGRSEAVLLLIELLADKTNTVRNLAERSLLALPDQVRQFGVEPLLALLRHPVPLTRSPAARLLGLTQNPRAFPALMELAHTDRQWLVRMWACKGLGDLGVSDAFETLADRLRNDEKNRVRAAAAEALGKLTHAGIEAVLMSCQGDEDGGVQKHIDEALAKLRRSRMGHDEPVEHDEPHFADE